MEEQALLQYKMPNFVSENLKRGLSFVTNNPQILYTVFIAIVIVSSFLFVSNLFLDIAVATQERFEKYRLSSMHDAFVELAQKEINNTKFLGGVIVRLAQNNETITEFKVVREVGGTKIVVASLNESEVGEKDEENDQMYRTTLIDPSSSFSFDVTDGESRFFQVIRAIVDVEGEPIGWVSTKTSLSQFDELTRKNIQTAYLILLGIIFVIVLLLIRHAKIIDYASLYKRLKEVDQMKDDFVSMASHELRSPLTVIRGYADILKGINGLSESDKKNIERIDIAAKGLDDLVADILDVSRLNQGRLLVKIEEVDIKEIVKNVSESFQHTAEEKNLSLYVELSDIPHILVDPDRFRQVVVNLVGNAVKYTKKGEVAVKLLVEGDFVVLRVSDTGIGMSEEERGELFGKFYRIRNDETKDIKGTGLGLWITKQIIEMMNGKISVESIKGVGSHFIVKFPVSKNTKPT
jgi:signal transduction histidine kinase